MKPEPIISKLVEFVEDRSARDFYWYTFVIIAIGYLLDIAGVAGNWAPRFGAVAAGTIAFSYFNDPRQHESWWRWLNNRRLDEKDKAEESIGKAKAAANLMSERGHDEYAKQHKTKALKDTRSQVRSVNKKYDEDWLNARRAIKAEGRCIAFGTLVWAFGDIPIALLNWGAASC